MTIERQSWHNCAHGLLLRDQKSQDIYICANESIVDNNHRNKENFGNIAYVKLTQSDKTSLCPECPVYNRRTDFRTHKKNTSSKIPDLA